jgi:hypothetical protein
MNIALKIYAVASANFCRRYVLVRRFGVGCALVFAGVSAVHAGATGDKDQRDQRDQREAQRQPPPAAPRLPAQAQPQPAAPRQGEAVRQFDAHGFDARAEEQRRALQMQQEQSAHSADAARRSGRLTPDERRDLRRQINEAGMDLYPNTPRR